MDVKELYTKNGNEFKLVKYYCGNCGTIHNTAESAAECCESLICSKCGKEIRRNKKTHYFDSYCINPLRCLDCYLKDKFDAMEVITEDKYDDTPVFFEDEFYYSLEEFVECYQIESAEDIPEFVQLAEKVEVEKINIFDVLQNLEENTDLEDTEDLYKDKEELYEFIKKWNEKQTNYYWVATDKKLKLSEKTKNEMLEIFNED